MKPKTPRTDAATADFADRSKAIEGAPLKEVVHAQFARGLEDELNCWIETAKASDAARVKAEKERDQWRIWCQEFASETEFERLLTISRLKGETPNGEVSDPRRA